MLLVNTEADSKDCILLNDDWHLVSLLGDNRIYEIYTDKKSTDCILKIYRHRKCLYSKKGICIKTCNQDNCKRYNEVLHTKTEVENLKKTESFNFVPHLIYYSIGDFSYCIITKLPGKDLFEYINAHDIISEKKAKKIIKQLLNHIKKLHGIGLIHKDLKPENLIYDESTENLYIIDFDGKCTEVYGSPEQLKGELVTEKTDVWSIGVLLYIITTRKDLFMDKKEVLNKPIDIAIKNLDMKDFITCLLNRNVSQRYSIEDCLNHSWITC